MFRRALPLIAISAAALAAGMITLSGASAAAPAPAGPTATPQATVVTTTIALSDTLPVFIDVWGPG